MSQPGTARTRLLNVALTLFTRHGVEATSLQMIADELGVTKAAVYHQFHAKEDIVVALTEPLVEGLRSAIEQAEAKRGAAARTDAALAGIIDLVVRNRHLAALLQADVAMARLMDTDPERLDLKLRIGALLAGPEPTTERLVRVAMVGGGLMLTGHDPNLAAVSDDELGHHLLTSARRLLGLRTPASDRVPTTR